MTVALLNTNTRARGIASPLTVAMNVNAGGTDPCAFVDVEFDQAAGMSITSVTLGGQAMTSCGTPSHSATQDAYTQSFFLKNPPTGTGAGAPSLVVTVSGTVTDIYVNLSVYQFVNQTNPVRPGTYQSSNSQTSTAGGQFSMTVASNTLDRTYTAINSPGGNTGTNQTSDGIDTGGAYSGASDHCTTPAASVTHTWSGLAASGPIAMVGFSINGDPNSTPSTSPRATVGPGRNPGRFQPSEKQPTAGMVPGATPDPSFSIRSLGPTSRGGRFTGPGGRPRQWAYVPAASFAQTLTPPAGAVRVLGAAPVLTPGGATITGVASSVRLIGQAPVLTPGGVQLQPPAGTIRFVGQAPTFSARANIAEPAATIRFIGQAPTFSAGAVSIAEPASTVRLVGQIPVLSNAGAIAVPAGAIRLVGQAPTFTPGAASRVMPAAVVRLVGVIPSMTGGVVLVVVDDRRRRWTGGVLRGR